MRERILSNWFFFFARPCPRTRTIVAIFALISESISYPVLVSASVAEDLVSVDSTQLAVCLPALERLGQSHNESAIPVLLDRLTSDSRPLVRRNIVEALGQLHAADALPALTALLSDADAQMRQSVVIALSLIGGPSAEAVLCSHVSAEPDRAVKAQIAEALSTGESAQTLDALNILSNDPDVAVQTVARRALAQHTAPVGFGRPGK